MDGWMDGCHINHKQLLVEGQKIIPTSLSHENRGFILSTYINKHGML